MIRELFADRRGRLLTALLVTEFGAAVQSVAYSSVLPIASQALGGSWLYGATLTAGSFTSILVLALGPGPLARLSAARLLLVATGLYVLGVVLCVAAPSMAFILIGTVVRGLAGGLLAGFGLTALGALYEDSLRARVYGLFGLMWLLPSLVGPVVNAGITVLFGWRAAMAWPAVLIVVGRVLIGRHVEIVPWRRDGSRQLDVGNAVVLLAGLVLAAAAWGLVPLIVGVLVAGFASVRILRGQDRAFPTVALFALCLAFFGGAGAVPLGVVYGLGFGIVASSVVVGLGQVTWSLAAMRPSRFDRFLGDASLLGLLLLAVALAAEFLAQLVFPSLPLLFAAWAVAGLGMGLSYTRISAGAFDALDAAKTQRVATAVAFAESAGTAIGSLISGGIFAVSSVSGWAARSAIGWSFVVLAGAAVLGAGIHAVGRLQAQH